MPPGITNAAFARDQNRIPITQNGLASTDVQNLTGSGATVAVPIFSITGDVMVNTLYGTITSALGNCTAAYWRLNDGTTQTSITLSTGTSLTNATPNSLIVRRLPASSALSFNSAATGTIEDPPAGTSLFFTQFCVLQKTGGIATNIEFVYTTSDTPTTGTIQFFLGWIPLTSISSVAAL